MLIKYYNILKLKIKKITMRGLFSILAAFFVVSFCDWMLLINADGVLEEELIFKVKNGQGLSRIAQNLNHEKVVSSSLLFKLSATMLFSDKNLQAGTYKFKPEISVREIITMLENGETANYKVTVPEGLRTSEILAILKNAPHVVGSFSKIKLTEEDLLLPETYIYGYEEDINNILERMKNAMEAALEQTWQGRAKNLPLKNKYHLLTLASIVEKETSVDSERAEVAGVFVNRLNKHMRLQSDPTVIYGLKNYNGNITRKHLKTKHPYNTYVYRGLPKGPIAHPGLASLQAAANPNKTDNLYFVADAKGGHVFAKSHAEHRKNVKDYLKAYRKLVLGK